VRWVVTYLLKIFVAILVTQRCFNLLTLSHINYYVAHLRIFFRVPVSKSLQRRLLRWLL